MLKKLNELKKNKLLLKFSSFHLVSSFAFATLLPFFSIILLEKGFTTSQITYFFAIFNLGVFIFSPVIGKLSDIFGKKNIIIFGLSFEILFYISYFFIENIFYIYLIRILDAIAYSSIFFVMIGAFEEMIESKRGFWTGVYMSIGTIGTFLGPIIAGIIVGFSTNKILLLLSSGFILISILFIILIPENKKNNHNNINNNENNGNNSKHIKLNFKELNPFKEIKHFLKFRELKGMALLGILMNSKGEIYNIFFPILVIEILKLPETYLGIFLSIPIFFHIFQFYFGKIGDNISSEFGVLLGVFLSAGSILYLPFVNNLIELVILLFLYGLGSSIWNVNAWTLMSNIANKYNIHGEIVGTYVSISKLGVFFATLISAYIVGIFGIEKTLAYIGIIIIISTILVYFFFKPIFHHKTKRSYFHKIIENK